MKKKKDYICKRCNRIFKNNYTLTRHTNRKNPCKIIEIDVKVQEEKELTNIVTATNQENTSGNNTFEKTLDNTNYNTDIYKKIQKNKNIWYQLNNIKID